MFNLTPHQCKYLVYPNHRSGLGEWKSPTCQFPAPTQFWIKDNIRHFFLVSELTFRWCVFYPQKLCLWIVFKIERNNKNGYGWSDGPWRLKCDPSFWREIDIEACSPVCLSGPNRSNNQIDWIRPCNSNSNVDISELPLGPF